MRDVTQDPYPPFDGVEPYGTVRSVADERAHRKRMCALGYRIFGAMRWGMLGDGHISARDPVFTDHFWLLDWAVPFAQATVDPSRVAAVRRQIPSLTNRRPEAYAWPEESRSLATGRIAL